MTNRAEAFAHQVRELETSGDVGKFVDDVFAEQVELVRPEAQQQLSGRSGAKGYWSQYLAHFDSIRSVFSRTVDAGEIGVLEWRSTGWLRNGPEISYTGVSVLDFDGDGRVRRFATYYDTTPFHAAPIARAQG